MIPNNPKLLWVQKCVQNCGGPALPCPCSAQGIACDGRTLNFPVFERIKLHFSPQLQSTQRILPFSPPTSANARRLLWPKKHFFEWNFLPNLSPPDADHRFGHIIVEPQKVSSTWLQFINHSNTFLSVWCDYPVFQGSRKVQIRLT